MAQVNHYKILCLDGILTRGLCPKTRQLKSIKVDLKSIKTYFLSCLKIPIKITFIGGGGGKKSQGKKMINFKSSSGSPLYER